jgi:MFS family permease
MVAAAAPPEIRGRAFGFHRMMDNFGAVVGSLLAFVLLRFAELPIRSLFVLSLVPGLLAVLVVLIFVREPREDRAQLPLPLPQPQPLPHPLPLPLPQPDAAARSPLPAAAKRYLAAIFVFSMAGAGDLFLLRRLTDLGLDLALVPVAWVSLQLGKGLFNVPGGLASDLLGRKRVLAIAWTLYAVTYAGYAVVGSWQAAWILLALYALHYGLAEGGQRALLADYVPLASRGRAYGVQLAIEGAVILPANVLFGVAYDKFGAKPAFLAASAAALGAAALLALFVPKPAPRTP